MPFFENISLEISGNYFNLTTNVNKKTLKFQISNPKPKIPEADISNKSVVEILLVFPDRGFHRNSLCNKKWQF